MEPSIRNGSVRAAWRGDDSATPVGGLRDEIIDLIDLEVLCIPFRDNCFRGNQGEMEDRMFGILGTLETQLLAFSQMRGSPAVRSEEIIEALGLTAAQTRELLSRMARRGLIARVRRGLYLVPPRLPPGGK